MNLIALGIAILTYLLIMFRGITKIPPWASMFFGGVLMIVFGIITPQEALQAINMDVILFLITLFVFASALEISGFLKYLAAWMINKFKSPRKILFSTLFMSGILANLVTNDGVSASWTPVIVEMKRATNLDEKPFLYALAFGVTIGSVMMPTGNPQNLLIALESNMKRPFILFLEYLAIPTILNLFITYLLLRLMFRKSLPKVIIDAVKVEIENRRLAYTSLALLIVTIILFFFLSFIQVDIVLGSLITSSILLLISKERREIIGRIDWTTIIFFLGLFIFTQGLIAGGIVEYIYNQLPLVDPLLLIFISSILLSQIISNVPLVAIFIPIMFHYNLTSPIDWLALAAGSTIAGNFTLIGAASNVIISEAAENRGEKGFAFFEFMKYGIPVLLVNFAIYYSFLRLEIP